jgi:hypothetical protein
MIPLEVTPSIARRRAHLQEMAARGTENEREIAKAKLASLEAKYRFDAPLPIPDIFDGWVKPAYARDATPIFTAANESLDAANIVKWILHEHFDVTATWRYHSEGADLQAHIRKGDAAKLGRHCKALLKNILLCCDAFSGGRPLRPLDRAPFLQGLSDGLLDEPRPHGSALAGYSPSAKPRVRKYRTKSPPASQAAAAIHPYDIGRMAGQNIRIDLPADELCDTIRLVTGGYET